MEDLRKKTKEELVITLRDKKAEREKLVQEVVRGKEKNVSKLRGIKKDIAQISTVLNEENGDKN